MRTVAGQGAVRPIPELLDTFYLCQRLQGKYRKYALSAGHDLLEVVYSLNTSNCGSYVRAFDGCGEVNQKPA